MYLLRLGRIANRMIRTVAQAPELDGWNSDQIEQSHFPGQTRLHKRQQLLTQAIQAFNGRPAHFLSPENGLPPADQPELLLSLQLFADIPRQAERGQGGLRRMLQALPQVLWNRAPNTHMLEQCSWRA